LSPREPAWVSVTGKPLTPVSISKSFCFLNICSLWWIQRHHCELEFVNQNKTNHHSPYYWSSGSRIWIYMVEGKNSEWMKDWNLDFHFI
jgi:hypothetical protein